MYVIMTTMKLLIIYLLIYVLTQQANGQIKKTAEIGDNKHKQEKRKAQDKTEVRHYDKIVFKVKGKK